MHECIPLKREYLHGGKLANGHSVPRCLFLPMALAKRTRAFPANLVRS